MADVKQLSIMARVVAREIEKSKLVQARERCFLGMGVRGELQKRKQELKVGAEGGSYGGEIGP